MRDLTSLLAASSALHSHLCPRQVLGVRMGLAGPEALGLGVPGMDRRLLVIAETDGCFLDGLAVAAGVAPGRRTMRIEDYGKVAATFVDVKTGAAVRLAPRLGVRTRALAYAPVESAGQGRHYFAQLEGYRAMPDEELFVACPVALGRTVAELVSRPGVRATCTACGEEIINEREVMVDGLPYCVSCARGGYYATTVSMPVPRMPTHGRKDEDGWEAAAGKSRPGLVHRVRRNGP